MGNRAFVTNKDMELGVYLHWNGGRDSVEAFCKYCKLRGFVGGDYGMARFVQVVANFFGGGQSIGIEPFKYWTMGDDNGLYVIDNWKIVGRYAPQYKNQNTGETVNEYEYYGLTEDERDNYVTTLGPWRGEEQHEYDLYEMMDAIDAAQPPKDQIHDLGKCAEVPLRCIKDGARIRYMNHTRFYDGPRLVDALVSKDANETFAVEPESRRYVLTDDGEKVYEDETVLVYKEA